METDLLPAGEGDADLLPAGEGEADLLAEGEADLLPAAGEGGEAVLICSSSQQPPVIDVVLYAIFVILFLSISLWMVLFPLIIHAVIKSIGNVFFLFGVISCPSLPALYISFPFLFNKGFRSVAVHLRVKIEMFQNSF